MNLFFWLIYSLYFYSLIARLSHWLSIWQQKEYRLDRFRAFLSSPDGRQELATLFQFPLSLSSFKRPKPTPKAILIFIVCLLLISLADKSQLLALILLYLFIPAFVLVASIPAWLLTLLVNFHLKRKAKNLFDKHKPYVIGITGSYGKTSTKLILTHLLGSKKSVWTSPKSFNTPHSLTKTFINTYRGESILIIEFAAYHRGEIASLARLFPPNEAIITGITHQHLATFKSFSNLIKAKSELPQQLPPGAKLFYNHHDPQVVKLVAPFHRRLQTIPSSRAKLSHLHLSSDGYLSFYLNSRKINTHLVGEHYLSNLKLAIAVAQSHQLKSLQIARALSSFKPQSNFIRSFRLRNQTLIIDDGHSCNPQGFLAALDLLSQIKAKVKIIISPGIIDLADRENSTHKNIGLKSAQICNYFIHTSPTGHQPLKATLKHKYVAINNLTTFKNFFQQHAGAKTVFLIEGKIPLSFTQFINQQTK